MPRRVLHNLPAGATDELMKILKPFLEAQGETYEEIFQNGGSLVVSQTEAKYFVAAVVQDDE